MTISVTCPNGHSLKAKESLAGKTVRCPKCKEPITIPLPPLEEADPGTDPLAADLGLPTNDDPLGLGGMDLQPPAGAENLAGGDALSDPLQSGSDPLLAGNPVMPAAPADGSAHRGKAGGSARWWIVGGSGAGVVALGLILFFVFRGDGSAKKQEKTRDAKVEDTWKEIAVYNPGEDVKWEQLARADRRMKTSKLGVAAKADQESIRLNYGRPGSPSPFGRRRVPIPIVVGNEPMLVNRIGVGGEVEVRRMSYLRVAHPIGTDVFVLGSQGIKDRVVGLFESKDNSGIMAARRKSAEQQERGGRIASEKAKARTRAAIFEWSGFAMVIAALGAMVFGLAEAGRLEPVETATMPSGTEAAYGTIASGLQVCYGGIVLMLIVMILGAFGAIAGWQMQFRNSLTILIVAMSIGINLSYLVDLIGRIVCIGGARHVEPSELLVRSIIVMVLALVSMPLATLVGAPMLSGALWAAGFAAKRGGDILFVTFARRIAQRVGSEQAVRQADSTRVLIFCAIGLAGLIALLSVGLHFTAESSSALMLIISFVVLGCLQLGVLIAYSRMLSTLRGACAPKPAGSTASPAAMQQQ